jgi:hypothetical protein
MPFADIRAGHASDHMSAHEAQRPATVDGGHMPAGQEAQAPSSMQAQYVPVTAADLVPPGFARHCAAVALWGCNLSSIWELGREGMIGLNLALALSGALRLASWLPGTCYGQKVSAALQQGDTGRQRRK